MEDEKHHARILTDANFTEEVTDFDGVVLVDYWAEWCNPCLMMAPVVEQVAKKYQDNPKVKVGKLNVDENEETAMHYRIMSLPTFKIFAKGEEVSEVIGGGPADRLEQAIQAALGSLS